MKIVSIVIVILGFLVAFLGGRFSVKIYGTQNINGEETVVSDHCRWGGHIGGKYFFSYSDEKGLNEVNIYCR